MLEIFVQNAAFIFLFDFGRYAITALLATAVIVLIRRSRFKVRKVQLREAKRAEQRREFWQSLQSVLVYSVGVSLVLWGNEEGWLYGLMEPSFGLVVDLAILSAIIVAHDAYFYWTHRAMHHPRLFRVFHRAHHRSITPTPWAAYSFAIPEAIVMFLFIPLWLSVVPTPGWVFLAWLNFQIIRNVMGHSGFEVLPRWWLAMPLTRWINTTVHHDLHHSGGYSVNFGLYFTWWDKWMGTEHPQYREKFEEVVARALASARGSD